MVIVVEGKCRSVVEVLKYNSIFLGYSNYEKQNENVLYKNYYYNQSQWTAGVGDLRRALDVLRLGSPDCPSAPEVDPSMADLKRLLRNILAREVFFGF